MNIYIYICICICVYLFIYLHIYTGTNYRKYDLDVFWFEAAALYLTLFKQKS